MLCSPSHLPIKQKAAPSGSPPRPMGSSVSTYIQESRRNEKWKQARPGSLAFQTQDKQDRDGFCERLRVSL